MNTQTRIPTTEEYEQRELINLHRELTMIEKDPLSNRQEARNNFLSTCKENFDHVSESIDWLLDGNYGYGAVLAFKRMTKRMNRRAWLFNTIAALEYRCPLKFTCQVWHMLDADKQKLINEDIDALITNFEDKQKEIKEQNQFDEKIRTEGR